MRKQSPSRGAKKGRLFNAIIVLLAIVLVILSVTLTVRIRNEIYYSYTSTPSEVLSMINRGDYDYAAETVRYNRAHGQTVEKDSDFAVPYAIADYYTAAFYRKGYEAADAADKAAEKDALMKELRTQMGSLEMLADDIDALF